MLGPSKVTLHMVTRIVMNSKIVGSASLKTYYCTKECIELLMFMFVIGFWKTNLARSILLAQLKATLIHHTYTVQLPGLVDWSAFLERVLLTL